MGRQISNPNPKGNTYIVGDGDYNNEAYSNGGTLNNSVDAKLYNYYRLISYGTLNNSGTLNNHEYALLMNTAGGDRGNTGTLTNAGRLNNYGKLQNLLESTLNNSGTLHNIGDRSKLINEDGAILNNSGTLNNNDGAMLINKGAMRHQRRPIAAGTLIFQAGSTFDNTGGRLINRGTIQSYIDNFFQTVGGTVDFQRGSKFVNHATIYNGDDETLNNVHTFTNASKFYNFDDSTLNNNGTLNNDKSGKLYNYYESRLNNSGTLNNNDDAKLYNDVSSELNNRVGGTLNNRAIIKSGGTLKNRGMINNSGTLYNNDAATLINKGYLSNNGTIDNSKNELSGNGFINYENGTYTGTGEILGDWSDHGTVNPGSSAGGMFVDGNYFKRGGSTVIELGGNDDGRGDRIATKYDWIEIGSNLELEGDLDVSLIDDFKLSAGDVFVITRVDGDLSGQYDGLNEGDSVGFFDDDKGSFLELFVTYEGGDGNDIALYTISNSGVHPKSLRYSRLIGSDADDSVAGTPANEVIFGGNGDDVLLGGAGPDRVTGGNGDDLLSGGLGADILKGDRGADTYKLSRGKDEIIGFSFAENDRISVKKCVDISLNQVGDDLLIIAKGVDCYDPMKAIGADGIHTTLLDIDKDEFLAADVIDYI